MDDHIYGNMDEARHHWDGEQRTRAIAAKTADFHHDGHSVVQGSEKKSVYKAAVVSLGVLCLLLLTGLLVLIYIFTRSHSVWGGEMVLLHSRFDNLTRDNGWLQVSCHNLSVERDQLRASYDKASEERDQLRASYNKASVERDQLRASYDKTSVERDQMRAGRRELERLTDQEGWQYFRGSVYLVSSVNKTWREGREDCQQRGADLLIINTREEQAFTNRFQKYLWIGLTDSWREGTWRWVDGTALYKSYWDVKEPNGGYRENCGEIITYRHENSWNDLNCNERRSWICEKNIFP